MHAIATDKVIDLLMPFHTHAHIGGDKKVIHSYGCMPLKQGEAKETQWLRQLHKTGRMISFVRALLHGSQPELFNQRILDSQLLLTVPAPREVRCKGTTLDVTRVVRSELMRLEVMGVNDELDACKSD